MSNKHNYSQYSNKKRDAESVATAVQTANTEKPAAPKIEEKVVDRSEIAVKSIIPAEVKMESSVKPASMAKPKPVLVEETTPDIQPLLVNETVETAPLPKTVTGVVANCSKLNVRAEPNLFADVVAVLDADTEIKINAAQSNRDWFKIYTAIGVEGYCMRRFVNAYM